jgi:uncharacterized membrane protein
VENDSTEPSAPDANLPHSSPVSEVIQGEPENDRRRGQSLDDHDSQTLGVVASFYAGPYPPPSLLREYDAIVPGLAKEIAEGVRSQTQHRQGLENAVIRGGLSHEKLGVIVGGVIAVVSTITGGIVAASGYPWAGGTIATGCVISLVGVFVYGTDSRRKEREKKAQTQQRIAEETAPRLSPQIEGPKPATPP